MWRESNNFAQVIEKMRGRVLTETGSLLLVLMTTAPGAYYDESSTFRMIFFSMTGLLNDKIVRNWSFPLRNYRRKHTVGHGIFHSAAAFVFSKQCFGKGFKLPK